MTDSDDPTSAAFVPEASVVARPGLDATPSAEAKLFTELLDLSVVDQLLGRMKNKALRRGLAFQASAPQSILSDRLRIVQPARGGLVVRNYQMKKFELLVCLDVTVDLALWSLESSAPPAEVAAEGDLVLF